MRRRLSPPGVGAATAVLAAVLFVAACASTVPSTTSSITGGTSSAPDTATTKTAPPTSSPPTSPTTGGNSTTTSEGGSTTASGGTSTTAPGDATLGKAIYLTGADLSGDPIPRSGGIGMMGSGGCVTCHGPDGEGGTISMMMGSYDVPDIRWSTISQPMQMNGETEPPYDPSTFARAVREGIGSDGDELESVMPRWQLSDPEVQGLIAYLKTL